MRTVDTPTEPPLWHQALAYAVSGRRYPELGRQDSPDVAAVASFLRGQLPAGGPPVGYPLPPELTRGIGPAQFSAAVAALRDRLDPGGGSPSAVPVVADRPLSADEQRLLREVPPHHGS